MMVRPAVTLTHEGALRVLEAAVAAATATAVPQCIAVVDEGCNLLAFVRMDGARVLSVESATHKADFADDCGRGASSCRRSGSDGSPVGVGSP